MRRSVLILIAIGSLMPLSSTFAQREDLYMYRLERLADKPTAQPQAAPQAAKDQQVAVAEEAVEVPDRSPAQIKAAQQAAEAAEAQRRELKIERSLMHNR